MSSTHLTSANYVLTQRGCKQDVLLVIMVRPLQARFRTRHHGLPGGTSSITGFIDITGVRVPGINAPNPLA